MEVLYKYDKEIAKQNGEIEICIKSFKQNKECAKAIDEALNENFSDNRLNVDKVIDTVVADFGIERVTHVLAAQVANHDWDGRYHNDVKDWAKEQIKGFSSEFIEESRDYYLTAHPILIDGLSSTVMVRQKELEKSQEIQNQNLIDYKDESPNVEWRSTYAVTRSGQTTYYLETSGRDINKALKDFGDSFTPSLENGFKQIDFEEFQNLSHTEPTFMVAEINFDTNEVLFTENMVGGQYRADLNKTLEAVKNNEEVNFKELEQKDYARSLIKVLLPDIERNSALTKEEDRLLYEKLIQERSGLCRQPSEKIITILKEAGYWNKTNGVAVVAEYKNGELSVPYFYENFENDIGLDRAVKQFDEQLDKSISSYTVVSAGKVVPLEQINEVRMKLQRTNNTPAEEFKWIPGTEISRKTYEDMYNSLPPISLNNVVGFQSSEPYSCEFDKNEGRNRTTYMTFVKSGNRYFYAGNNFAHEVKQEQLDEIKKTYLSEKYVLQRITDAYDGHKRDTYTESYSSLSVALEEYKASRDCNHIDIVTLCDNNKNMIMKFENGNETIYLKNVPQEQLDNINKTYLSERNELEKVKQTSELIDTAISESKVSDNQYKLNKALSKVSEKYSDEEISAALSSDYCKSHPKLIKKFSEKLSERKQANEQVMVLEDECTRGR